MRPLPDPVADRRRELQDLRADACVGRGRVATCSDGRATVIRRAAVLQRAAPLLQRALRAVLPVELNRSAVVKRVADRAPGLRVGSRSDGPARRRSEAPADSEGRRHRREGNPGRVAGFDRGSRSSGRPTHDRRPTDRWPARGTDTGARPRSSSGVAGRAGAGPLGPAPGRNRLVVSRVRDSGSIQSP
jgi:hypothetical protein